MPKIIVASMDYDGCLSHQSYQAAIQGHPELDKATTLMDNNQILMAQLGEWGVNVVMVGSNRQDVRGDVQESLKSNFDTGGIDNTGSCFGILNAMSGRLGAKFNSFLLGDLYSNKPDGYTVSEAMKLQEGHPDRYDDTTKARDVKDISFWTFDHQKVSIVYAQMQKLALENPGEEIEYHFIDDREDILQSVEDYFKNNPEMIPGNVTLKINRYYNSNPDRSSPESIMKLEDRATLVSNSPKTEANPLYKETLQSWAKKNTELEQIKDGAYDYLKGEHDAHLQQHQVHKEHVHQNLSAVIGSTKTHSKSANEFIHSKASDYPSAESYKNKLVEIFKESWDKQYYAGKVSIGYSAVLRGITKELEKNPKLLDEVKNDLKAEFQREAQSNKASNHPTYQVGNSFRGEEFERDWKKFTGVDANIIQRAAKTIMQAFKKPKEQEAELTNSEEHNQTRGRSI